MNSIVAFSPNATATEKLGEAIGRILVEGDVLLLSGDLGSGKTALTRGIALGIDVVERVLSPTFVLVRSYVGRCLFFHADLYRLGASAGYDLEFLDLGRSDGVTVVEWGELSGDFFDEHEPIYITFEPAPSDARVISMFWSSDRFNSRISVQKLAETYQQGTLEYGETREKFDGMLRSIGISE